MWVNLFVGDPDGPNKFRWIYISLCFSSQCIVAESCIVQVYNEIHCNLLEGITTQLEHGGTHLKAMQFNFAASQNALLINSQVLHYNAPAATNTSMWDAM